MRPPPLAGLERDSSLGCTDWPLAILSKELHRMNHQGISLARSLATALFVATLLFAGTPLTTAQTETTIHAFKGVSAPLGGLVADAKGALYGTTYYGGEFGQGSVYEMAPPSTQGRAWTMPQVYPL